MPLASLKDVPDFECHITMKENRTAAYEAVRKVGFGWSFSCIEGDPLFGDVTLCYATNHFHSEEDAKREVRLAVRDLASLGMKVIRAKIEQVIEDTRWPA